MVAVAADGSVAAGASSNGAIHKVPGRVGDAAVPGGGAYADSEVGGCGATGACCLLSNPRVTVLCCCCSCCCRSSLLHLSPLLAATPPPCNCHRSSAPPSLHLLLMPSGDGDAHLAFLPCYQVVESMRAGVPPQAAAEDAIRRIARRVPSFTGAVVAVSRDGRHGGAAHGWKFRYSVARGSGGGVHVEVVEVEPLTM